MLVTFDSLPGHARIWIYQASTRLSSQQEEFVRQTAQAFCEQWAAHGNPLRTSFALAEHQFLILAVDEDEEAPSGCSIDSSVHVLRLIEEKTGANFLDRSKAAFLLDDEVRLVAVSQLKQSFREGILGPASKTFHTLAATKREFVENWIIPAEKSWMARFLPQPAAN